MRVAIVYPPLKSEKGVALLTQNRQFQWFRRPTYIFPVVPATAATMLSKDGHEVLFLDGIAAELSEDEFERRLAAFAPELVVLETKTPVVKRHWRWIDAHAGRPAYAGCRFALVGDHVTALPEESMRACAVDYVVTGGDWDFLLRSLVAARFDPARFEPGVWYRAAGGALADTGRFRLDHDLNAAPWIDRDLVNWRLYAKKNGNFRRTPGTYVMAGRDCWHARCTFCSWTTLYPSYRTRDPIDVVDELEMLAEKHGVREVMDDSGSFPAGPWLTAFCNEMIRRGLNRRLRIDCNMRFGRLTAEDYRLMRRAGFQFVLFGVESANQATLDCLCKKLTVDDVLRGCEWAHAAGLRVHLTFMFGHAWEGPREIAETVRLARRLLAKGWASTLQCTLIVPYPGTPLFRELKESGGLETLDWDEYDMRRAIIKTPLVDEAAIKRAIRDVYRGFFQPAALARRLFSTRTLADLPFYYRGLRSLLGHLADFRGGAARCACQTENTGDAS